MQGSAMQDRVSALTPAIAESADTQVPEVEASASMTVSNDDDKQSTFTVEPFYNKHISQADLGSINSDAVSSNSQTAVKNANVQKPSLKESMEQLSLHGESKQLAGCL